jgi:CheY-like chemotaxis protein
VPQAPPSPSTPLRSDISARGGTSQRGDPPPDSPDTGTRRRSSILGSAPLAPTGAIKAPSVQAEPVPPFSVPAHPPGGLSVRVRDGKPASIPSGAAPPPVRTSRPAIDPVSPGAPLQGLIVLLVEDEAPVRMFAARALRLQGCHVLEADTGEQALDYLRDATLRVDLFLSDVVMPGLDGPGWVSTALAARPQTPVIFMSGYAEDALAAALARVPRSTFLGKPFSLRELIGAVQERTDRTRARLA